MPIHLFHDDHDGQYAVWLDTDIGEHDGLCLALGRTAPVAISLAQRALSKALRELEAAEYDKGAKIRRPVAT